MKSAMKILLVGNGNTRHAGARYYDPAVKLAHGLTRNGHHVYFFSDRDHSYSMKQFATPGWYGSKAHKIKHISRFFLDICRHFKPDCLILVHADLIAADAVAQARRMLPDLRVAQMNVDIIFNAHNAANIRSKQQVVDASFITTAGPGLRRFACAHGRVAYIPNMVDPSIEWPRCFARHDQPHDVFWALRALRGFVSEDRRIAYPLYLEQQGVNIRYHGMNGQPMLLDAGYFEAINDAKMGLNISQIWTRGCYERAADEDLYLYSSDRIGHYMGSGLLTFMTRDHRLEELFIEDEAAVYFDSKEELCDKIRYYASHDAQRQHIAQRGWELVHQEYNERRVARYLLEATFSKAFSEPYRWPVEQY